MLDLWFPFSFPRLPHCLQPSNSNLGHCHKLLSLPTTPAWMVSTSWSPSPPISPGSYPSSTLEPKQTKGLWKWADIQEAAGTICPPPTPFQLRNPCQGWNIKTLYLIALIISSISCAFTTCYTLFRLPRWQKNLPAMQETLGQGQNNNNKDLVLSALHVLTHMICCCLVAKLCPTALRLYGLWPTRLLFPWNFPSKNTGTGCHYLLQGIRWILYYWAPREARLAWYL